MVQPTTQTPPGWHIAGTIRTAYVAGVDPNVSMGGGPSGYLKSTKRTIDGFGTLMQGIAPDNYVGGRIRASCYLKTVDVSAWAALWVRVDGDRNAPPIAFDNMEERAVKGTTDWTECVVVLDVGPGASNITFGVLLSGTGTVWIDRMKFEAVDQSVPVTGSSANRADPRNLDFAERPGSPTAQQPSDTSANDGGVSEMLRAVVGGHPRGIRHCSFCGKPADAVKKLIVGGGGNMHICDECVALCAEIVAEPSESAAAE